MRNIWYKFVLAAISFVVIQKATAQITITHTDVSTNFINTAWVQTHDSSTATYDLGNSANGQTWNFSALDVNALSATRDTTNYYLPTGHVAAASFPTAVACAAVHLSDFFDPYTLTIDQAQYFSVETDGAYSLGYAMRQQISPTPPPPLSADTTYIGFNHPKALGIPLPMTNSGSTRTSTDTLTNPDGSTKISTHTFTMSGSGTMTIPGGRSFPVIRVLDDHISVSINHGIPSRTREKSVLFYGQDLTEMRIGLNTDTLYSTGSTQIYEYTLSEKLGTTAVHEISNAIPAKFRLEQNYPNPFNPSTTFRFQIARAGSVSLKVYDILGKEVASVVDEFLSPGTYSVPWYANVNASGVYYYRLTTANSVETKKLVLMR